MYFAKMTEAGFAQVIPFILGPHGRDRYDTMIEEEEKPFKTNRWKQNRENIKIRKPGEVLGRIHDNTENL